MRKGLRPTRRGRRSEGPLEVPRWRHELGDVAIHGVGTRCGRRGDRWTGRCVPSKRSPRRDEGFLTPVGWLYLTLTLAFLVALIGVIAVFIAGSHSTLAQRAADLVAERGAQIGLGILITPPPPGSPGSVIEMSEPVRTEVLTEYITDSVLPPDSSLWRYLAPLEPGVDVVLSLTETSISVTVTARAGRNGQFITTRTASGAVAAANYVAEGRISLATGVPGGVLPLALDESALAATFGTRAASLAESRSVALDMGRNAFAVALDDSVAPADHLRAVSAFLAAQSDSTPSPAMRTGQRLVLARSTEAVRVASGDREDRGDSEAGRTFSEQTRVAADLLAPGIFDRPVIVPVVRDNVVAAFAVGRLGRQDDQLLFEPIQSALSPLTGFDAQAPRVPAEFRDSGLALALRPTIEGETPEDFAIGSEEAVG